MYDALELRKDELKILSKTQPHRKPYIQHEADELLITTKNIENGQFDKALDEINKRKDELFQEEYTGDVSVQLNNPKKAKQISS